MIYVIGFLAQLCFSARILIQWLMSERARKVLSPTVFWILSLAGAYLLCLYGWLRKDFAIVMGQFLSYYIYVWNLNAKHHWATLPALLRLVILATPVVILLPTLFQVDRLADRFFSQPDIPLPLLLFGVVGQVVFSMRFLYQWYYSHKHEGQSLLPAGFWWMSLSGSFLIEVYALIRLDPVLLLGQSFGMVAYARNLIIGYRENQSKL